MTTTRTERTSGTGAPVVVPAARAPQDPSPGDPDRAVVPLAEPEAVASRAGRRRADLGPPPRRTLADLVTAADPAGMVPATARVGAALVRHPRAALPAVRRYGGALPRAALAAASRLGPGQGRPLPAAPAAGDRRFADPAWQRHAGYALLGQQYLLASRLVHDLLDAAPVDDHTRRKARFLVEQLVRAAAPTNTLAGNPAALKQAFTTGGTSLVRGGRNAVRDLVTNRGMPRQTVPGALQVGRDLAVTPGAVVFRNDLVELIQYAPQTERVDRVPLLLSPPWINKYYLMDLSPGRSLVEWAVQHGHTVFTLSYRNPDRTMHDVGLDDYLLSGPHAALDVIRDITGSEQVDLVGLCLGGTLTAALLAYLAATGEGDRVRSLTLLNTLTDFSDPGELGVFTDDTTVERLTRRMQRSGFLDGRSMRSTFDLLRVDDLVWSYAVSGWLMGEDPPVFDILAWNSDSTRMPAGMHAFYLRSCYLDNALARGEMELAGQRLSLDAVGQDAYVVGAEQDHIALWRSVYGSARLLPGDVRFVLSSAGHVAGVVNPPHPKARYRARDEAGLPEDPERWLQEAREHRGSWWEDWVRWLGARGEELIAPPGLGSRRYPVLADAPGTYVFDR